MATHKLGKLKINTSGDGIAFRFGDGKIHRLSLGKKSQNAELDYNNEEDFLDEPEYADDDYAPEQDYADDYGDAPVGYRGRFAQSSRSRSDDDYDDGYDGEYGDGYEEEYDDGYDDGYADDDGYYEDGYADEDGAYDDRYLDEDATDYDPEGYADESPLMRYVDENDWVSYLLLVLLPPLGIYLLWRRRRFDPPVRWAISGASALWFIVVLILLISALLSGTGDTTTNPPITLTTATSTVAVNPSSSATPSADSLLGNDANTPGSVGNTGANTGVNTGIQPAATYDALSVDATATPLPGGNIPGASTVSQNTVLITTTGVYYHNNAACANVGTGATSTVTLEVAQRNKTACPICYPGQTTYYATADGKYYHSEINCSEMKGASVITAEAAAERGQQKCPVCITHEIKSMVDGELRFVDESYRDKSGITVYATQNGKYYHEKATCDNMKDGSPVSLLSALVAGKRACPDCLKSAETMVYCTEGGKKYHNAPNCSGMENAHQVTLAEALVLGKKQCDVCWGDSKLGVSTSGNSSSSSSGSSLGAYVYATSGGKYYHTLSDCSGMKNPDRVLLSTMVAEGRAACPECCEGADRTVYATKNGKYYHSYATCSGMKDAQSGTLAQAMALGKDRCPECWQGGGSSDKNSSSSSGGTYVYATKGGTYYHTNSSCSGMEGASRITLSTATSAGKRACPTCASGAEKSVYSTSDGTYYHTKRNCSGMEGASKRTVAEALSKGQKACPVCIGGGSSSSEGGVKVDGTGTINKNESAGQSSGKYDVGTSGIRVYATPTGKHYHTKSDCSGMTDASHITLETALNYGKTACDRCADSADTKVYAVKGGKYYHYSKSCAGDGAKSGERAEALAYGFDPCPYCVTKKETPKDEVKETYKAGTSGIKVWASINGKYYHADQDCAGSSASKVTLETALNYGKRACSSCASSASKTVYATGSGEYYHSSRTCAGDDAVSGSFAKALAMGKKECPVCIGGSESYEESDVKYSAPADTTVYIDLDSEMLYYHKGSRCGDGGLSGGTGVALDFVVDWGFRACPYCNPATDVD